MAHQWGHAVQGEWTQISQISWKNMWTDVDDQEESGYRFQLKQYRNFMKQNNLC